MRKAVKVLSTLTLASLLCAQSDRGAITGTISDPAGAVVPGAKIVVTNTVNGAIFETQSNEAGNFILVSLPSGTYALSVEAAGFKKASHSNLQVQIAQTIRVDTTLQVGAASESVTVTAEAPLLRTDNGEQSMNVRGDKINNLPLNFGGGGAAGGGIRNWLSFVILAPGVSGTAYNSPINGLPGGNFKVYVEGQDTTSVNDSNWTSSVAGASVETIEQFAVQASNFSAEYGQALTGFINFTTKSGTNQLRGSVYEYWANEVMNARRPFNHVLDRDRKNDYGFTIGGPVYLPKLYDGRNKTFFFFGLERFANNQLSVASLRTVPTLAYRNGDFSQALVGARSFSDTLTNSGMTFLENSLYDPATTTTDASGRIVRTLFPDNVIPAHRLDPVAKKIVSLFPSPINNETTLNWQPDIVTNTKQQIPSVKIDHTFSDKTRMSFYWGYQSTTQVASPDYQHRLRAPGQRRISSTRNGSTSTTRFRRGCCCTGAAATTVSTARTARRRNRSTMTSSANLAWSAPQRASGSLC